VGRGAFDKLRLSGCGADFELDGQKAAIQQPTSLRSLQIVPNLFA